MTYVPDPRAYQQLVLGGATRAVDCTAWGAAFRVDAHTKGAIKTNGRAVRLHSDEPVPDPGSPGLSLGQVDASVIDITNGKVNFDTRVQSRSLSRADVRFRIVDGRFCGLSVWRGVFVDRGFASGFRGAHDVTLFTRDAEPDQPLLFDSLVAAITRVSWDVAFDAAETLTGGRIYAQFTRDLTPDYHAVIKPTAGHTLRPFYRFLVDANGRITGTALSHTKGTDQACSVPAFHSGTNGIAGRYLVRLSEGPRAGWYVNARFAEELNP